MSENAIQADQAHQSHQESTHVTDRPAIGIIATAENADSIARMIIRATKHDQQVLVTYSGDTRPKTLDYVDVTDSYLIDPPSSEHTHADLRETLVTAARTLGYPGLFFHGDSDARIDYEASFAALTAVNDGYCIDTIPESGVSDPELSGTLVAIPAYNEAATISAVVSKAREYADEVLVIDDGSEDETASRAAEAGATVIEHEGNEGYGGALKTAFQRANMYRAQSLVTIDGDGQHDPEDIPKLVAAIDDGADLAIGSRFVADADTKIPFYRRVGLTTINVLTNLSLGVVRSRSWMGDTQSGYRAYSRRAIRSLAGDREISNHMSASTDILYHAHHDDYTLQEVETSISYDVANASSHNPLSHGIHLLMNILKTVERDRPITFLGIPGFTFAFVGLGFGYWTISNFLNTETFPIGLAIISMFFVLSGVFACFSAIILHALSTQLPE